MSANSYREIAEAVAARTTGDLGGLLEAYVTKGGTYVLSSNPVMNDDYRPHDLLAVTAGGDVLPLRPTVHPDLVSAVKKEVQK